MGFPSLPPAMSGQEKCHKYCVLYYWDLLIYSLFCFGNLNIFYRFSLEKMMMCDFVVIEQCRIIGEKGKKRAAEKIYLWNVNTECQRWPPINQRSISSSHHITTPENCQIYKIHQYCIGLHKDKAQPLKVYKSWQAQTLCDCSTYSKFKQNNFLKVCKV